MSDKVTELYAWVVKDPQNGNEGIPAVRMHDNMIMPLMGSDMPSVESIRPLAQFAADAAGNPIRLLRFTNMEVVETIHPTETKQ